MNEEIKRRQDFDDVDIINTAYLVYDPYNEVPGWSDYKDGETRSIILRNRATGMLEQIDFKYSGYVPRSAPGEYHYFWGDVLASGPHCCLAFYFDYEGNCEKIAVSFCGTKMSHEKFKEIEKYTSYPAQFTAAYDAYMWGDWEEWKRRHPPKE